MATKLASSKMQKRYVVTLMRDGAPIRRPVIVYSDRQMVVYTRGHDYVAVVEWRYCSECPGKPWHRHPENEL